MMPDFTQLDPTKFRNITYNGQNSLTDLGLVMSDISPISDPSPIHEFKTLAYSDTPIRTSNSGGEVHFNQRTIDYTFTFFVATEAEVTTKLRDIYNWLYRPSSSAPELLDTEYPGRKFTNAWFTSQMKSEKQYVQDGIIVKCSSVTASFDPYLVSGDRILIRKFASSGRVDGYFTNIPSAGQGYYGFFTEDSSYNATGTHSGTNTFDLTISYGGSNFTGWVGISVSPRAGASWSVTDITASTTSDVIYIGSHYAYVRIVNGTKTITVTTSASGINTCILTIGEASFTPELDDLNNFNLEIISAGWTPRVLVNNIRVNPSNFSFVEPTTATLFQIDASTYGYYKLYKGSDGRSL